jgi:hypothetical protein
MGTAGRRRWKRRLTMSGEIDQYIVDQLTRLNNKIDYLLKDKVREDVISRGYLDLSRVSADPRDTRRAEYMEYHTKLLFEQIENGDER